MYSHVLVLTDNRLLWQKFIQVVESEKVDTRFIYCFSSVNKQFLEEFATRPDFLPVNVKTDWQRIAREFDLVISLHCKQIFPLDLVRAVKCINIHPGLNPYNRGWFPQAFSIINKLPLGATIHEMDEQIDHGPIIDQEEVPVFSWDTSLTAYDRVVDAEMRLIRKNLKTILRGDYSVRLLTEEGNLNKVSDYRELCLLDLNERGTLSTFLDRLRALTHGDLRNAYFVDKRGKKVFVKVELQPDNELVTGES